MNTHLQPLAATHTSHLVAFVQERNAMTMIPMSIPCPDVNVGDYRSYLCRADWWLKEHGLLGREQAEADLEHAAALAPDAWEPWAMRAEVIWGDAAWELRCYDEAIRRGAGAEIRTKRGRLLDRMDRLPEAEADYTAVLNAKPGNFMLRHDRALVRAELGDLDGALEDVAPGEEETEHAFLSDLHATLLWIKGDFAAAYRIFASPRAPDHQTEQRRVWSHLCQIAHGVQGIMSADALDVPPVHGYRVVATTLHAYSGLVCGDAGPEQPQLCLWELFKALFLDRITPDDVMDAAQRPLRVSDAWRPPVATEGVGASELMRPPVIWRSEVQFYCGMWYLSKRRMGPARQALTDAATGDCSRTLERLAAAAQLRRLHRYEEQARPVQRLVLAGPDPQSVVARFVGLDLKLANLKPSARGVALDLADQALCDRGLEMLLASPNTRFVNRLDLRNNGITTAGMAAFRESSNTVNIVELNLAGNRIGDTGLGMLLRSSALVVLASLDLTDTGLTDEGAALLASQKDVGLERIVLGNTAVDMPIWRRLAERYGDGLFARGVFKQPYAPPFDPAKRVCFVHTHPPMADRAGPQAARSGGQDQATTSAIVFELSTYVAWRLERAADAQSLHYRRPGSIEASLAEMRELEAGVAAGQQRVHVVNSAEAFDLLRAGFIPISLHCGACAKTYAPWSGQDVQAWLTHRYLCPAGHELDAEVIVY